MGWVAEEEKMSFKAARRYVRRVSVLLFVWVDWSGLVGYS